MGNICETCFGISPDEYPPQERQETPAEIEERRRRLAEAASKRQKENEDRGLQDPEAYKAKQKRREEIEQKAAAAGTTGEPTLKWTVE